MVVHTPLWREAGGAGPALGGARGARAGALRVVPRAARYAGRAQPPAAAAARADPRVHAKRAVAATWPQHGHMPYQCQCAARQQLASGACHAHESTLPS